MQGGRLKPDEKQSAKPRGGLARWVFADGSALLLTEAGTEKRAGVWVRRRGRLSTPRSRSTGSAPTPTPSTPRRWPRICAAHSMRLHGLLRDQRAIAGIGRRLANEICHRARLSPFANAAKLDARRDRPAARGHPRLHRRVARLRAWPRRHELVEGAAGAVHHRAGEACPVCGDVVREVEYTRYTVNYCATCQTGGKVLADNTTSKFLK